MKNFEKRLLDRGYPTSVVEKHLSEVKYHLNKRTGMHVQEYSPL